MKIEFKKMHAMYRSANNALRLGAEPEITSEVEDPNGYIEALIRLCDGTRRIEEIHSEFISMYPEVTSEEIDSAIQTLDQEGFMGGVSHQPTDLTPEELERYNGNLAYFYFHSSINTNKFAMQERLKNAKVVVLGLGGAGMPTVLGLASYGVGHIVGVDYDRVELGNLNRQFLYTSNDIGRLKTEVAKEKISAINPDIQFDVIDQKICCVEDIERVIEGADLLICCADEPVFKIQRWVNKACYNKKVKALFGLSQVIHGRIFHIEPDVSGCLDCAILTMDEQIPSYSENFTLFRNSGVETVNTVVAPFAMFIGGMIVDEAVRSLTGYLPVRSVEKMFELNYTTLEHDIRLTWQKHQNCPTCGESKPEFEHEIFNKWMEDDDQG